MKPLFLSLCLLATAPAFAGDAALGKSHYGTCATCHGGQAQGNAAMKAPALAGLGAAYIERQLKHYREGIRGGPNNPLSMQMIPMAKVLPDDAAIADVAAYIVSLEPPTLLPTVKGDPEAGKQAYAICATCHGSRGEGNAALNAPALVYQDSAYLARQIHNFKSGLRGVNPKDVYGMQMAAMAKTLPDEAAIKNVVAYIETLRPAQAKRGADTPKEP